MTFIDAGRNEGCTPAVKRNERNCVSKVKLGTLVFHKRWGEIRRYTISGEMRTFF